MQLATTAQENKRTKLASGIFLACLLSVIGIVLPQQEAVAQNPPKNLHRCVLINKSGLTATYEIKVFGNIVSKGSLSNGSRAKASTRTNHHNTIFYYYVQVNGITYSLRHSSTVEDPARVRLIRNPNNSGGFQLEILQ